jgi:hypothetical protein
MDIVGMYAIIASILGGPILVVISWLMWIRTDQRLLPSWRAWTVMIGICCASANILLWVFGNLSNDPDGQLKFVLGNYVGVPLVFLALVSAAAGKGASRVPLAISALLGFLVWITPGFL